MCKRRMEIFRKIDEAVNMCVNSYKVYMPHKELCLCCFLTVSCPKNTILASINVSVSHLL